MKSKDNSVNRSAPKIAVLGSVSLDLVTDSRGSQLAKGAVGNSGANIAIRLAHAGWDVEFITLIGRDDPGRLVLTDLQRWGVGTRGVIARSNYRTPLVFQIDDGRGSESLLKGCPQCMRPRRSRIKLPERSEIPLVLSAFIDECDVILTDIAHGPSCEIFESSSALRWYEASLFETTDQEMTRLAEHSDVLKCSAEEYAFYERAFQHEPSSLLLKIITDGSSGAWFSTRDNHNDWTGCKNIASDTSPLVIDTIGAGDAFTANVVDSIKTRSAIGSASTIRNALLEANRKAARACEFVGARGDLGAVGAHQASPWIATDIPFKCSLC